MGTRPGGARTRTRWLAVVATLLLLLAACGGDDDDPPTGGGEEEPGEPSKGTVKLGFIGSGGTNSQGQPDVEEARKTLEAWERAVNANGGVNGFDIEVVYKKGSSDNALALQAYKELVADGVLAVTHDNANMLAAIQSEVESAKVPILCGSPYQRLYESVPLFFHCGATNSTAVYGQVGTAAAVGAKHFRNAYCAEIAACAQSAPVTKAAADKEGLDHSQEALSSTATNYTPHCLSAKNAGVDYLQLNGNFATTTIIKDCAQQNYHPTYGVVATTQAILDSVGEEDAAGNLWDFPSFYEGPETRDYHRAMERTDLENLGAASTQLWKTGKMFEAVLELLPDDLTAPKASDFLAALYEVEDETLGGLAPPITYGPAGRPNPLGTCWYAFRIIDGEYTSIDDTGEAATELTPICQAS
jgi:branched-chain amino acid transport system substrate-binding protein